VAGHPDKKFTEVQRSNHQSEFVNLWLWKDYCMPWSISSSCGPGDDAVMWSLPPLTLWTKPYCRNTGRVSILESPTIVQVDKERIPPRFVHVLGCVPDTYHDFTFRSTGDVSNLLLTSLTSLVLDGFFDQLDTYISGSQSLLFCLFHPVTWVIFPRDSKRC